MSPSGPVVRQTGYGGFYNFMKEALERLSEALMMVQVGLAWVVPTDVLRTYIGDG